MHPRKAEEGKPRGAGFELRTDQFDFMAGASKHAWSGLIYGATQATDLKILARAKALDGFIKVVGAPVSKVMQEAVGGSKAAAKIALVMDMLRCWWTYGHRL